MEYPPLWFVVNTEPVVAETGAKHDAPADAQPVQTPVVVNGMLSKPGELDYYDLDVFYLLHFTVEHGAIERDPVGSLEIFTPDRKPESRSRRTAERKRG